MNVRYTALLLIPVLWLSCGRGEEETTDVPPGDTISAAENDPMLADTLVPTSVKDTLNLDEYGKDSLKLSAAFQLAANELSQAYLKKDVFLYCKYTPPNIVEANGGPAKYRARVKEIFATDHVLFDRIVSGPVKRVQAAVDDEGYGHGWYCLMPVRRFRTINGKPGMELQWLGGQTLDMGKTIYFLDITGKTRQQIEQVMPDLRFVLDQEAM
jgi:hypothetical protein